MKCDLKSEFTLQGVSKKWAPGCVKLDEKVRFCLPSAGRRTQLFHHIFTQPGAYLLEIPCKFYLYLLGDVTVKGRGRRRKRRKERRKMKLRQRGSVRGARTTAGTPRRVRVRGGGAAVGPRASRTRRPSSTQSSTHHGRRRRSRQIIERTGMRSKVKLNGGLNLFHAKIRFRAEPNLTVEYTAERRMGMSSINTLKRLTMFPNRRTRKKMRRMRPRRSSTTTRTSSRTTTTTTLR